MQAWMTVLIVFACVAVAAGLGFVVAAAVFFTDTFGRGKQFKLGKHSAKYGANPEWLALPDIKAATDVLSITSFDGLYLEAVRIRARENNNKIAVVQHGYRTDFCAMQPYAQMFFERGYDVLLPSARAHGNSGGKYIGMAWLDRFDVLRWIDKVNELYAHRADIVLMGVSMGGATVAAVSGMDPPREVKCMIDDCGFSSVSDEYDSLFAKKPIRGKIMRPALDIAMRLKLGYALDGADITELVAKSDIPALFIHGTSDDFVPFEHGRKLYEACAAENKRLFAVDGAEHARCYVFDKDAYKKAVFDFVDGVIKP